MGSFPDYEQSKGMGQGERIIGSSEVLESLFGKLKYMEHEQTSFGFTSLVLAAMAHVGPSDTETIGEALKTIKVSDIDKWSAKEIGTSVQSQRRQMKKMVTKLQVKMVQEVAGLKEEEVVCF